AFKGRVLPLGELRPRVRRVQHEKGRLDARAGRNEAPEGPPEAVVEGAGPLPAARAARVVGPVPQPRLLGGRARAVISAGGGVPNADRPRLFCPFLACLSGGG